MNMNFVTNVIASAVGGAILVFILATFSQKARWILIGVLSRILDVDIDFVFKDMKNSEPDMRNEIDRAGWLCFFAGRGNELQRDTFNSVFAKHPSERLQSVRILLPDTSVPTGHYDWLKQREQELASFDPAYGNGLLFTQIESNVTFLKPHIKNPKIQLCRFNLPNIGRIVLTDRCLFYTPYKKDAHGRHSRVYKFRRDCDMYDNMLRLFDQIWDSANSCFQESTTLERDPFDKAPPS
jgi:hypothetical protein